MKLSNRLYDILKGVAQIWLPAAGTAYLGLAQIWNLPSADQVIQSVVVVDTFLGVVLGLSTSKYNQSDDRFDGSFNVIQDEDGGQYLKLADLDPAALNTKGELRFKINPVLMKKDLAG